jgi:hypothetical protein
VLKSNEMKVLRRMSTINNPPTVVSFGEDVLERMVQAARRVLERLERATLSLEHAGVPFAVGGSNATAVWIASVDAAAVRQARNVELVLLHEDFAKVRACLQDAGFAASTSGDKIRFLDGPEGNWRDGIEVTFAREQISQTSANHLAPHPESSDIVNGVRVLRLATLVQFQLARYRLEDVVDLRDMIEVGLIDRPWLNRLQPELASRLQELLDNPDG